MFSRTPDEIKKGLECCQLAFGFRECGSRCPYYRDSCCGALLAADALALIQQLESDKQQLEGMLTHMNQLRDAAAGRALQMEGRVHQLEAERDAAVADIRFGLSSYVGTCMTCVHGEENAKCDVADGCAYCKNKKCVCNACNSAYSNWQWRGIPKEDGNEST